MPSPDEKEIKDTADKALGSGHAREALALYGTLLSRVQMFESGIYESWLSGALGAYRALGRRREAGYVLLGLRRFADAEACFSADEHPLDWALAVGQQHRHAEAARILAASGHSALAAVDLEAAGEHAGARAEWERVLANPRLRGLPYETALAYFNLGETLLRLRDAGAGRVLATAQRMLEELADDFETRGERERAFDCYGILLRLGKDTGSFENVAEGYLNSIRLLAPDGDHKFFVLQYYEDFLAYATERRELHAAATLAREAADYSLKANLVYDRHYLRRAAELWRETARHNEATSGPHDLSENALHAAIDAASSLGDLALVGQVYASLAALPLPAKKRDRYAALARRYAHARSDDAPVTAFPPHLRRPGAYQDVWRLDLVEWELGGEPAPVLARLVAHQTGHAQGVRLALRALLLCADPNFVPTHPSSGAELGVALGRVQMYEVLSPLERLYEHPSPQVRAAVMTGVGQVYCKRSFNLVRKGLGDAGPGVRDEALRVLRALRFRDGFDSLARIFRESSDGAVREVALATIADIGSPEAGLFLIEVVRHETGALHALARTRLASFTGDDLAPIIRQYMDLETGSTREALQEILEKTGG